MGVQDDGYCFLYAESVYCPVARWSLATHHSSSPERRFGRRSTSSPRVALAAERKIKFSAPLQTRLSRTERVRQRETRARAHDHTCSEREE